MTGHLRSSVSFCFAPTESDRPHHRDEDWSAGLWQAFFASCVGATVPALAELPLSTCGCKKFVIDAFGDHVRTCTTHSGAKKAHDWTVDQLADLFHTTHKVKTQQVVRSRGQRCGDIELSGYLANAAGPVSLVLSESVTDKIRKYRADCNNNPPNNTISFMSDIAGTSGRLHSEFLCLLFLQAHRETDRFFAASRVQLP
jgi:hypothetical protein